MRHGRGERKQEQSVDADKVIYIRCGIRFDELKCRWIVIREEPANLNEPAWIWIPVLDSESESEASLFYYDSALIQIARSIPGL